LNVDEDPFSLAEGEPAFLLDEGIAYVRGWATAQHAVSALRSALTELDQENAIPRLRADVNVFGTGIVELGHVTPQIAALIAEGLLAIKRHSTQSDGTPDATPGGEPAWTSRKTA
jgi:hypothetical protein